MQSFEKYLNKLPVIPDVASKILSINDDNQDFSFRNLEEIISVDPMLTTRILKVANSALYARQKEITTLQMAIGLLGFKNIKSLVLLLTASQFSKELKSDDFYTDFWKHSIVTAFIAREIYYRNKDRTNQDLAFTLGLLHDIGKVALYNADPKVYETVLMTTERKKGYLCPVEQEFLQTDHEEIGAILMAHWNLPEIFGRVCGQHGKSGTEASMDPMIRNIAAADVIAGKLGFGSPNEHFDSNSEAFLKGSDVSADDLSYFLVEYSKVMEEDPLFLECKKLFFGGS